MGIVRSGGTCPMHYVPDVLRIRESKYGEGGKRIWGIRESLGS